MNFNPRQALGLPAGSVRAIIALMLTVVTCALAITHAISGEAFLATEAAVVAFYFGSKQTPAS